MTSPIDTRGALSYRLPIGYEPVNRLVSEIFSINVADKQTDTSTDKKGRLKFSSRASQYKRDTTSNRAQPGWEHRAHLSRLNAQCVNEMIVLRAINGLALSTDGDALLDDRSFASLSTDHQ